MPFLEISPQLKLFYLDLGLEEQPAVLLLHGLGVDSSSWQLQVPALLDCGFRILSPDAPGFGRSSYPGGGTSISKMASYVAQLLESTHTTQACVVGISMGGTLALQLALDHPETVSKLVLVNTFARLVLSSPKVFPYFALRFILVHTLGLPTQAKGVAKRLFPNPGQEGLRQTLIHQIVQCDPRGYRASMRALARFNVQDRLSEIQAPTLVITGECDTTVPPDNQRPLAVGIPSAGQIFIPHAGHAVIVEKPEEFNQSLIKFLLN